jgi:hypothetical protein
MHAMTRILVIVALLGAAGAAGPFRPKTYDLRTVGKADVALDGVPAEDAWQAAPAEGDFSFPWEAKPAPPTVFRAFRDAATLYFSFVVNDPDVVAAERFDDESVVDGEDRVEIFLACDAALKRYYCIEIDPRGRVHDYAASFYRRFNSSWNCPGLRVAASITPSGYAVEAAVPLHTLGSLGVLSGGPDSVIRAGIFRAEFQHGPGDKPQEHWISWVNPRTAKPDFHVPTAMGLFRTSGVAATSTECEITDITWTLGPEFPALRKGGAVGALHDKVISAGGMQQPWCESPETWAYAPGAKAWERLPDMPQGRVYMDGVTVGDAFYVVGGRYRGRTRAEVFRLRRESETWRWDQVPPMKQDRMVCAMDAVGRTIVAAGGVHFAPGEPAWTPTSTLSSAESLDTRQLDAGWRPLPSFPGQTRDHVAGAGLATRFYVFGGCHHVITDGKRTSPRLTTAAFLATRTGKWSPLPDLPFPLSGHDAVTYRDRYIILLGGAAFFSPEQEKRWPQEKGYYNSVVLVFDTKTNTYHPMPSPMPHATNDIRAALIGDTIYALGGENIEPQTSNTTRWFRIGRIRSR